MTPEEFKSAVKEILKAYPDDPEASHARLDDLMELQLVELGYEVGIRLIQDSKRWYG